MTQLQAIPHDINLRVKRQYEAYPYPDYSLFIPLRHQEAYASHSLFASRLAESLGGQAAVYHQDKPKMLLAGCGDILPYMLSFWEPEAAELHAWDLSERNIQRARFRCAFRPQRLEWKQANLEDRSTPLPQNLAHIESYGVLHHLANPSHTLQRFSEALSPGGTLRIMVYNSEARSWIHQLQRAFALLGLSPYDRRDLDLALGILRRLQTLSPALAERLNPMRHSILNHSARFVDTFFHEREARLGLDFWLKAFQDSGLHVLGLYDRYAELDDLPNPLLNFPSQSQLDERVSDRRFENNFEFYLQKPGALNTARKSQKLGSRLNLKTPPKAWFTYSETHSVSWALRFRIWTAFLSSMRGITPQSDGWLGQLPDPALKRLARIGAILPLQTASRELQQRMRAPLHDHMEAPQPPVQTALEDDKELIEKVSRILARPGQQASRQAAVMRRLSAAQRP